MPISPTSIRLEAATICQLRCPSCPTAGGEIGKTIGSGFLKFDHFKKIADDNPWILDVELSNWGEIFLNPELDKIIKYAHEKGIALRADNGVNLNNAREDVLEALVRYGFKSMTCSIDGTTQESYAQYRVNGNLHQVLENIRTINRFKDQFRSELPRLTWQFVAFGHNQHEIEAAKQLAQSLKMKFWVKLSWDDLYTETFSPVTDLDLVRKHSDTGVATRSEFRERYGREYLQEKICSQLWHQPQVNWDGRVLGCCVNYWGDFGNAFTDGLLNSLNGEKIEYARNMLLGRVNERENIPCSSCKHYKHMKAGQTWLRAERDCDAHSGVPRVISRFKRWLKAPLQKLRLAFKFH